MSAASASNDAMPQAETGLFEPVGVGGFTSKAHDYNDRAILTQPCARKRDTRLAFCAARSHVARSVDVASGFIRT